MKRVVLFVMLCLCCALAQENEAAAEGVADANVAPPPSQQGSVFWGSLNGALSLNFVDYSGVRIAGTLNAGFGWFHLGAGYAYTPGSVSADGVDGDLDIGNVFGRLGVCFHQGAQLMAAGLHFGSSTLSGSLSIDGEEVGGSGSVFHMGVYGEYNFFLAENLALNVLLRTDYLFADEAYTKLYDLGAGLSLFF
jgi:hypothetical protein